MFVITGEKANMFVLPWLKLDHKVKKLLFWHEQITVLF